MKVESVLTIAGPVIAVFGMIFHLQGMAVVGPESSFMYSNPDWTAYGIQIVAVGAALFGGGVILMLLRRR